MSDQAKFCVNCTHHQKGGPLNQTHICTRLEKITEVISPVTGQKKQNSEGRLDCSIERSRGPCGPEGLFYEPLAAASPGKPARPKP